MMRALYTAATGMLAQQTNVDNISNNLSNVNTVGFKQEKAEFKSLLYQTIQTKTTSANGEQKPIPAQVGLGTRVAAVTSVYTQERCRRVRMIPILQSSETDFCSALRRRRDTLYQSGRFCVGSGNQRRYTDQSGRLSGAGQQ